MSRMDRDRELADFLARRSTWHRHLSELDHSEPPPELDRLVLEQARRALEGATSRPVRNTEEGNPTQEGRQSGESQTRVGDATSGWGRWGNRGALPRARWALPVALAASVLVAVGVTMTLMRTGETPAARRIVDSAPMAAARDFAPAQNEPAVPEGVTAAGSPQERRMAFAREEGQAPVDLAAAYAAPPATDVQVASARVSVREDSGPDVPLASVEPASALAATADAANADAVAVLSAPGSAAGDTPAQQTSARSAKRDPRAWLEHIEQLRSAGRIAEAERELIAYRKAFPHGTSPSPSAATANERPPTQ